MEEENGNSLDEFRSQWQREIVENQNQRESSSETSRENLASSLFQQAVDLERKNQKNKEK